MRLILENFGMFTYHDVTLQSEQMDNGKGKTTIINAYYWVLSGKTLNGFEPRRRDALDDNITMVALTCGCEELGGITHIHRTLKPNGTELYVDYVPTTQKDFIAMLEDAGISYDLLLLCADANALTDPSLSSETLRTLLAKTGMIESGTSDELRKKQKRIRAQRKEAEKYAITNVTLPVVSAPALTSAQQLLITGYESMRDVSNTPVPVTCPCCGQRFSRETFVEKKVAKDKAVEFIKDNETLYNEAINARDAHAKQVAERNSAQGLIAAATVARNKVRAYDTQLKKIDEALFEADAKAVNSELPAFVEVVTESTAKTTGNTRSICTLTYKGVPLKSVNYAKRVDLCVQILDVARQRNGGAHLYPIIIDNAESVQPFGHYGNIIRYSVPQ